METSTRLIRARCAAPAVRCAHLLISAARAAQHDAVDVVGLRPQLDRWGERARGERRLRDRRAAVVTAGGCPGAGRLVDRQRQPEGADRDRERAVGGLAVRRVCAEQLELDQVAGGEVPGAGVELEGLEAVAGRPVELAGDERLGVRPAGSTSSSRAASWGARRALQDRRTTVGEPSSV